MCYDAPHATCGAAARPRRETRPVASKKKSTTKHQQHATAARTTDDTRPADGCMIMNKPRPSSWIQRLWAVKVRCVLTTSRELPRASRSWAYGSAAQSDLLMSDVSPSDPDVHPIRFNASSRRGDRSHQHAQPRYAAHSRLPPANEGARNAFVISYSSRDFIILDQKFLVLR